MNRDFFGKSPNGRDGPPGRPFPRRKKFGALRLSFAAAQLRIINFLLQIGEPQTKDLNYRHYSRGRATTF